MHPIHVLISRAANVVHIPRTDDHALQQLRASVFVVREFVREVLMKPDVKAALKLNEEAFHVAKSDDGQAVWHAHEIDVFAAVLQDWPFGAKFANIRYPQMRKQLDALRG